MAKLLIGQSWSGTVKAWCSKDFAVIQKASLFAEKKRRASESRGPSNIYRGLLKVWLEILYVHLWIPCHIFCYFRLVPCQIC